MARARYGVLVVTAYDAELWTDAKTWSMEAPFALTLRYHMGFSTDDFVSRGLSEMKHVDPSLDDATLKRFGDAMTRVFPAGEGRRHRHRAVPAGQAGEESSTMAPPTGSDRGQGLCQALLRHLAVARISAQSLRAKLLHLK